MTEKNITTESNVTSMSDETMSEKEMVEKIIAEKINADVCQKCGKELHGNLGVSDIQTPFGWAILIGETSPRNWIACDGCNAVVCHSCCQNPFSGFCDDCIKNYELENYIEKEFGA